MWWRADASVARRIQPTFGSRTPHVTNIYQNRSPWTCMKIALVSLCSIPHTVSSPSVQCTATQHIPTDANGAHETGSKVTFDTTGVANIGVPRVPHLPTQASVGLLAKGRGTTFNCLESMASPLSGHQMAACSPRCSHVPPAAKEKKPAPRKLQVWWTPNHEKDLSSVWCVGF